MIRTENLTKFYGDIISTEYPSIGNKESDMILIEFVDYNCGFCKKSMEAVIKLSENFPDLKVIFKDFPILASK